MILPEFVEGSVHLQSIEHMEGFTLPKKIHGSFFAQKLVSIVDTVFPELIRWEVIVSDEMPKEDRKKLMKLLQINQNQ